MTLNQLVNFRLFRSQPCACCGFRVYWYFPLIWDRLAKEWELGPSLRRLMDKREGVRCLRCRTNWRIRHLANVLLGEITSRFDQDCKYIAQMVRVPAFESVQIAEINELPGLHRYLSLLKGLSYSEYGGENSQNLMALSYADASFDYVLTSDTLEHVPDFDLALSEIRRVLRPGGKHIFTIPVIWDRQTRQRAEAVNGTIAHHFPASHHGGLDVSPDDYLVFNEFGADVVQRIEKAGFSVALVAEQRNELVVTIVATKGDLSCVS